jgi:cobalt-zinc-cadmium efflux system outer membrane protein
MEIPSPMVDRSASHMRIPLGSLAVLFLIVLVIPSAAQVPGTTAPTVTAGRRLTLQEAFAMADRQNLDLAATRLRHAVSQAGILIAGARPNPTASFSVGRDTPHELVLFDLPVELGGKRARRMDLARQEVALTDLEITAVSRDIRQRVREAFYSAALAVGLEDQQKQLVDLSQKLRDIAQARFESGDVPQLEVMQTDLELARASADWEVARVAKRVSFTRLSTLLNEPAETEWDLVSPLESLPPQVNLQDLVSRATDANADLQHLAQELNVERSREKVFRAGRVPDISLEGVAELNSPPDFHTGARGQITIGLPILYRNQGELAQSSATLKLIEAETSAMRRAVAGDVEAALNELNTRLLQVDLYRRTVIPVGRKLEALAEESYRSGRANILAVLDAQRTVQQNEKDYLQSLFELQKAFADLEHRVGVNLD